jgi:hypothetical protein
MNNVNDIKIMELKKQIEVKKTKLAKSQKFSPITNCSFDFEGARYNINTLQRHALIELLVRLNMVRMSVENLGLLEEYKMSGYLITEWIEDIKSKLDVVSRKLEEANLKIMEDKLNLLLSNEKKVELEISEIESLLK